MGAIWTGFRSKPWDPEACRQKREAWEREHRSRLRERLIAKIEQRHKAKQAFDSLTDEQKAALEPYLSL